MTMNPPVRCTDRTPTSASTAAGMRSRCRRVEVINRNVGTATPYAARLGIAATPNST